MQQASLKLNKGSVFRQPGLLGPRPLCRSLEWGSRAYGSSQTIKNTDWTGSNHSKKKKKRNTATDICTKGSSTLWQQSIIIHVLQRTPAAPAGVRHEATDRAQNQRLSASAEAEIVLMHRPRAPRALARNCVKGRDLMGIHKSVWEWHRLVESANMKG